MNSQNEIIPVILAGRVYLYTLLQHVFGGAPTLALLKAVTDPYTRDVLELLTDEGELADSFTLFSDIEQALSSDAEGLIERLKDEYTYLLIGPAKLPALPWESVYVTKERLIFQESTLDVRRAYRNYQLLPAEYPHVADDHIAIELDFMAHLGKLSQERFEAGETEELKTVLTDQKAFLDEHMLRWVGQFAELMQNAKTRHFYPQMAALTARVLQIDHALLEELISAINQGEER